MFYLMLAPRSTRSPPISYPCAYPPYPSPLPVPSHVYTHTDSWDSGDRSRDINRLELSPVWPRSAYSHQNADLITGETIVLHRIGALNTGSTCHHDEELDTSRLARLEWAHANHHHHIVYGERADGRPGADALNGARLMRRLTRLLAAAAFAVWTVDSALSIVTQLRELLAP